MEGERRVVTMPFCDEKGSTAAAQRLDPEDYDSNLDLAALRASRASASASSNESLDRICTGSNPSKCVPRLPFRHSSSSTGIANVAGALRIPVKVRSTSEAI